MKNDTKTSGKAFRPLPYYMAMGAVNARRFRAGALLLSLCLWLTACDNTNEPPAGPVRTVLFYLGGDNNLSAEANARIESIAAVPLTPYCRTFIYVDTEDAAPRLMEVVAAGNANSLHTLREYEESNSASAQVFASVLREVKELSPTPSYGLVLFSHATGWLPAGTYSNPAARANARTTRTVTQDGASEMELPAFAAAIPNGMFHFVIFEACYMAGVEVAYELKDKTRYIVASAAELVSPGFWGCYSKALPHLYAAQVNLAGFCQTVQTDYATRGGDYASLTLSLIDAEGLDAIAPVVRGLGLPTGDGAGNIQAFDRGGGTLFFDLASGYPAAKSQDRAALQASIDACVVWKTATEYFMPSYTGFAIEAHCGLTVYIPRESYPTLNEAYKELKWYKHVWL